VEERVDDEWISVRFDGNRTVTSELGGSGAITNGMLSFSIGTPSWLMGMADGFVEFFEYFFDGMFDNLSISVPTARGALLIDLETSGGEHTQWLERRLFSDTVQEIVVYLFVDQDVVITADGITHELAWDECWCSTCDCDDCDCGFSETITIEDLNLSLRRGWNALFLRGEYLEITDGVVEISAAISLGDPARLRWYLWESSGFAYSETIEPASAAVPGRPSARLGAPLVRARQ